MSAVLPSEPDAAVSPFGRNGYHDLNGFKSKSVAVGNTSASNGQMRAAAHASHHGSPFRNGGRKQMSSVCEQSGSDACEEKPPHASQDSSIGQEDDAFNPQPSHPQGLFSWIRRFTSLGRRTQSSIDMPAPPPREDEAPKAEVPRRSYSDSELGTRRRAAAEYVRPSAEQSGSIRRSAESFDQSNAGSEDMYGRPSDEHGRHNDYVSRRRKAYEAMFAKSSQEGHSHDNHFLNEELAARSSLFNSGS